MKRYISGLGIMALIVFGLVSVSSSSLTAAAPSALADCVTRYTAPAKSLAEGQVKVAKSGAVAVGGVGTRIVSTAGPKGRGSVSVAAGDDSNPAAMAKAYKEQGRSVLKDAQAAGLSVEAVTDLCRNAMADELPTAKAAQRGGEGRITDSWCTEDSSHWVQAEGCVVRYVITGDRDPVWRYGIDDAQAWAHETSKLPWIDLHMLGIEHEYGSPHLDIIKIAPSDDQDDIEACQQVTFGLSILGFGLTTGGRVCPEKWTVDKDPIKDTPESYTVKWHGQSNSTRSVVAISATKVKAHRSTKYTFHTLWDVH